MITPRPYLSWSSMDLFEKNPKKWVQIYLYNAEKFINRGQAFGKKMAEGLENGEMTGDPVLDMVMEMLPKFELMDKPITAMFGIGEGAVPLLAKPDTAKKNLSAFKEYKTGQAPWSKKDVDESGQISFYATTIYVKTGRIPQDIELVHVKTEAGVDGKIRATGEIKRHPTKRTMVDILKMMIRMKKVWTGIKKTTEDELL